MRHQSRKCPNCEGIDTDREHVEWYTYEVEEVRVCNECPTEYTLNYADPVIAHEETHD